MLNKFVIIAIFTVVGSAAFYAMTGTLDAGATLIGFVFGLIAAFCFNWSE